MTDKKIEIIVNAKGEMTVQCQAPSDKPFSVAEIVGALEMAKFAVQKRHTQSANLMVTHPTSDWHN